MAREFHDLARLARVLVDTGPLDTSSLASRMRLPAGQTDRIVERAVEVGLAVQQGQAFALTGRGRAFAGTLEELEAQAQEISRERFRPYSEYLPTGWSTE